MFWSSLGIMCFHESSFEMTPTLFLFLLCSADSCFEKGQAKEHGASCSCMWRRGCEFCWGPDPWCSGLCWCSAWACSWRREVHFHWECKESSFLHNPHQRLVHSSQASSGLDIQLLVGNSYLCSCWPVVYFWPYTTLETKWRGLHIPLLILVCGMNECTIDLVIL